MCGLWPASEAGAGSCSVLMSAAGWSLLLTLGVASEKPEETDSSACCLGFEEPVGLPVEDVDSGVVLLSPVRVKRTMVLLLLADM